MTDNDLIDLILGGLDKKTLKQGDPLDIIIKEEKEEEAHSVERVNKVLEYMVAQELITRTNTLGDGIKYKLTNKATTILHENRTYTKYLKSISRKLTLFEKISIVAIVISGLYILFGEIKSYRKDKDILNLQDTVQLRWSSKSGHKENLNLCSNGKED